jgi:hypothetical protein
MQEKNVNDMGINGDSIVKLERELSCGEINSSQKSLQGGSV